MPAPSFIINIPANVQSALNSILNGVGGSEVRQAIVTAITWGVNSIAPVGNFVNSLGLMVHDGKLCYTNQDVVTVYDSIPSELSSALQDVINAEYGRDTRASIVKVLQWGGDYISSITGFIDDLGLTIQDGKLCVYYYDPNYVTKEVARQKSIYANPGVDVDDAGYTYVGA